MTLDPGFSVLVVLAGAGRITSERGGSLALRRGGTTLIPHAAGGTTLSGSLDAVRCRPPSVEAAVSDGLAADLAGLG